MLVTAEQGSGDQIQMARFLARVRQLVGRLTVECNHELYQLLLDSGVATSVVRRGEQRPAWDLKLPIMSLPLALGIRLEDLPACGFPYLQSTPTRLPPPAADLLNRASPGRRVGITWAGTPSNADDHERSCPLELFERVLRVPGVSWFSLQVGLREGDDERLRALGVPDIGQYLGSFADTAAALEHLDLVVAVDTSIVHLAGALGKPVCVALPFDPDWRWLAGRERTDTPWYPSMTLLRQQVLGDWYSVLDAVRRWLTEWSGGR
jgi:hypothetical protein